MFESYYVDRIIRESTTIKSFYLKRVDGKELDTYLPGQFVTVQVQPNNGKEILTRNYTLSDAPGKDYYRLTIKREEHGKVSQHFHDILNPWDRIKMSKPTGNFYLSNATGKPVVLLSGGVGITPMISMLEYILKQQDARPVYFIHSSLNMKVQPFSKWLRHIATKMDNVHLTISHTFPGASEKKGLDHDHKGLLSKEYLETILPQGKAEFYLCGPIGFMDTMYTFLNEMGVNDVDIFYEFFGEKKLLGSKPKLTDSGLSKYQVVFKESRIGLDWSDDFSNILDFAEAHGIQPLSSCRMGTCLTCETKLVKGEVEYDPEPFMDMPNDKILICCSKPKSDLEIEI